MRSNTSRPPFSQYLCTELILSKSDSFYVKAVDLDDYRTACAVNKSFLTLYFFKKVYRILGSPVIIKNNLFHHFNMNILNRFVFGIVIVNISLCELPEILQLNPAYIHSSAFRIKSMISSNERSLSTYASYNACFALSIFRFGCRSSSSVESSSARTLYSFCNNGIGCQVKHEAIFSSGCSASGKYFLKFFNPTFDWNKLKYRFPFS